VDSSWGLLRKGTFLGKHKLLTFVSGTRCRLWTFCDVFGLGQPRMMETQAALHPRPLRRSGDMFALRIEARQSVL
jgi:hypothetical protein